MKLSALKRKRCAQLFATNRAQIHPRNAENSYSQPQGVKLDTHVAGPLLHVMLANPLLGYQVYGLPPAVNLADRDSGKCIFRTPGTRTPEEFRRNSGGIWEPEMDNSGRPSATCRRPEGAQAPFQTRDCDRGLAGRGQSSSQSPVTLPEFHP